MEAFLIEAEGISVTRGENHILRDVSLRLGPRDFITVIGPNGAGKSMLLKCLMGLYMPDSGVVKRIDGLRLGYVPQHFSPEATLPITPAVFIRLNRRVGNAECGKVIEETGIGPLLDTPLDALSGGERQRVLLARALLDNPQLLVLDEPAQNLDISGQLAFYKLLDTIYEARQISILMVSHDLHLVMASSKHVVCLFHHICCSGAPESVARDPAFTELFGTDFTRQMAVYHHAHDHKHEAIHGHGKDCAHD